MKKYNLILIICMLFTAKLMHAQTVTISPDNNRISFVITDNTTKAELQKAEDVFADHGISASIKVTTKKGAISKMSIFVSCSEGTVKYHTTDPADIKKGITILIDKTANAAVALGVGTSLGQ